MTARSAILAAIAVLLGAGAASSQELHGHASLPGSLAPASGAIVTLLDSANVVRARSLTSEVGEFRLRAPAAGSYRVRALRIGFRPTTSDVLILRDGEVRELRLELTGAPISLRGVAITAERQCATESASSAALDAWDEARKALDASVLSRDEPLRTSVVRRERRVRVSDGAILAEHDEPHQGMSLRPYVSIPAETIAAKGYVIPDGDGAVYAAPDEEILLAPDFASTHCLRLVAASADSLALGFTPARDRRLPEISGVLVFEPATHELRELVFRYVNTGQRASDAFAGGRVHFRRLAAGRWIVDAWSLRLPLLARMVTQRVGNAGDMRSGMRRTTSIEVTAYQETSGEVTEVARGPEVLWASSPVSYAGTLFDEERTPVAGAVVRLPMLERETKTAADGGFRLEGVSAGPHQIVVRTPLLDSLGLPPLEPSRSTQGETTGVLALTMPGRGALIRRVCALPAAEVGDTASGMMRGVTRSSDGAPFGGVTVIAEWFAARRNGRPGELGANRALRTVSDDRGEYVLCGIRTAQPITMRVEFRGLPIAHARVEIPKSSKLLLQDFIPAP